MPFYEYHCAHCGHHHEALQKVSDKPLRKCPACGRPKLKRLISAPVFRLKGGGWYETDFKSEKEARRNLAGEKDHAESKPEAADKPKEAVGASEKKEPAAAKPAPDKPAKADKGRDKPARKASGGKSRHA